MHVGVDRTYFNATSGESCLRIICDRDLYVVFFLLSYLMETQSL